MDAHHLNDVRLNTHLHPMITVPTGFFIPGGFNPLTLSPALWLDASDSTKLFDATSGGSTPGNGVGVARWEDKSGNDRNALQSSGTLQPTRRTSEINGRDIVRFDGSNDILTMGSDLSFIQNSAAHSIFIILKTSQTSFAAIIGSQTAATNPGFLIGLNNTSPNRLVYRLQSSSGRRQRIGSTSNISSGSAVLIACSYSGGGADVSGLSMRINGADESTTAESTHSGEFQKSADAAIGDRVSASLRYNGDIGEILIYPSALSTDNRNDVESYLAAKWGITL